MPTQPTYPGVYIEEIPSGVRTITGVATSITAFIGRALRGPTHDPVSLTSFADFERVFGGLWIDSSLGYAVRDFYRNGGSHAIVVRLAPGGDTATMSRGDLDFSARSPGEWANTIRIRVEDVDEGIEDQVADRLGVGTGDLFNLIVRLMDPADPTQERVLSEEAYPSVTVVESSRRVDRVVNRLSGLVTLELDDSPSRPTSHPGDSDDPAIWKGSSNGSTRVLPASSGSDGDALEAGDFFGGTMRDDKEGLYALEKADLFNLLCLPPYDDGDVDVSLLVEAAKYCIDRRAFLIVDPPSDWTDRTAAIEGLPDIAGELGSTSRNAAIFFPRLQQRDPLLNGEIREFAPCGSVAGTFARTDATRGVWKAPAGLEAALAGVSAPGVPLTDPENGFLNPLGINCIRTRPPGRIVIWGSRTLDGDDRLASEWKYIPIRRLALFLEESLYRGTQWVVFEPNDEPLWAQIRLNVGAFMHNLFRQGAFQGSSPRDAYFVKCDAETTTQTDRNLGIVNILVGFAPLKPAEFVIIKIQQIAGQIET